MGNIQSLQRTGTGSTLVDNLSYTYHQGRLQSVHDAVSVPHSEYHLPGTAAYTYDANGNMLSRTNPTHTADNLSAVSYNYLDLPNSITTTTGTTTYTYDAQGRKLQSSQAIGSQNREYIDGIEYEDGVMELIHLPGSRIVRDGSSYSYQYFLKDQLGNNRASLLQGSEVTLPEFSADYYPFGLRYQGIVIDGTSPENHYLYNNKEWQDQIRMYDYGARLYDPVIGRWSVVDPLAEVQPNKTPYHYTSNNPINRIDPTGMLDNPIYDEDGNFLGTDDKGLQGKAIVMNKDNFTQGMSHEDALSHSLGAEGLSSSEAQSSLLSHYNGLKDRPDYDGRITLNEANDWYRNGNGEPLFADLGQLNLSSITPNQFENKDITYFNLLFRGNRKDGLVYGTIGLTNLGNNEVKGYFDDYDFDIRPWNSAGNVIRNIETKIGDWYNSPRNSGSRLNYIFV